MQRRLRPLLDPIGDRDVVDAPVAAGGGVGDGEGREIEEVGAVGPGVGVVGERSRPWRERGTGQVCERRDRAGTGGPGVPRRFPAERANCFAVVLEVMDARLEVVSELCRTIVKSSDGLIVHEHERGRRHATRETGVMASHRLPGENSAEGVLGAPFWVRWAIRIT